MIKQRVAILLLGVACSLLSKPCVAAQPDQNSSECSPTYENHNMVDYGPLKVSVIRGTSLIQIGNEKQTGVPSGCFILFTEGEHKFVGKVEGDSGGRFELKGVTPGRYRLIARLNGFCTANIPVEVVKSVRPDSEIAVHFRPRGIDTCSFGELALPKRDQDKSLTGDFSKSPTEHIIIRIEQPFVVRSVKGFINREQRNEEPLPGVLFEIQGPGDERKIRQARTDEHGRFRMGRVPLGTYQFKATIDGFQSVMGTVVVSKGAAQKGEVKIEMRVGV